MTKTIACLAALVTLLLAACASPQAVEETPTPAAETEEPVTRVTLTPEGDHLLAEWSLPEPVTAFQFDDGGMSVPERAAEWTIDPDVFEFNGYTLTRKDGAAFDSFKMTVPPAQRFYDRFYVPVFRVGEAGWGVHVWAFAPEEADIRFRFAGLQGDDIVLADGAVLAPDAEVGASDSRMIYFGPASNVHRQVAIVVAGSDVPDWLREHLDTGINDVARRLTDRLGRAPDAPPVLFITYQSDWASKGWKGGSLDRYITIHLRGMDLSPDDAQFLGSLRNMAAHETAHVWLGQMYASVENDRQSWLEEGAAEYFANRLWMDPDQFRAAAGDALGQCRSLLGDASLLETEKASRGPAPYKCGFLVELIAEAAARQQGSGDILDLWRAVFAEAKPGEDGRMEFDTETFRTIAARFGGEAFTSRLAQMEAGLSPEGWSDFIRALPALGIGTKVYGADDAPPDDRTLSQEVLKALLLDQCDGGYSIYGERDHFFLDMGARCPAPLSENPKVAGVNGFSLIGASGEAYSAVRKACAVGEPLVFAQLDGADLPPIACGDRLSSLPDVAIIESLPDFGPL